MWGMFGRIDPQIGSQRRCCEISFLLWFLVRTVPRNWFDHGSVVGTKKARLGIALVMKFSSTPGCAGTAGGGASAKSRER